MGRGYFIFVFIFCFTFENVAQDAASTSSQQSLMTEVTVGGEVEMEELKTLLDQELENRLAMQLANDPSGLNKDQELESKSTAYSTSSIPLPSQAEYHALMDIYQSTGGANWTNNTGWSTADPNVVQPVGGWHGVGVDPYGRVTSVNLIQNNLVGTLPASIQNLVNLESLWLFTNNLIGQLPNVSHKLPNLKDIQMAENQFSGSIPDSIGFSPSLEVIGLAKNALTGTIPTGLGNLSSLKWLILYDNQLTGSIPLSLGGLSSLEYLYLYRNNLTGSIPYSIENLTNLKFIGLHGNRLSGVIPVSVGNLTNLEELFIYDNEIVGSIPAEIGNLTKLTNFWMSNNKLTGAIPSSLGNLKLIHTLFLMQNQLEGPIPPEMGGMNALQYLRLSENKLEGQIPSQLGNLYNVIDFMVDVNDLTGQVPPSICALPNLVRFRAHTNQLEGDIPLCLLTKGLNDIWFSYNNYSFDDLVGKTQYFPYQSNYSPQRTSFEDVNYVVYGNGGVGLTTDIGKNLSSPSKYQWYKDGIGVTAPSTAYDSIYFDCPAPTSGNSYECEGIYQVFVTNTDYPGISLLGPRVIVDVYKELEITICMSYQLDLPFDSWLDSVTHVSDRGDAGGRCLTESDTLKGATHAAAVKELENTWLGSYYRSASITCLEDASETLNMTVTNKEHHYNLDYHDLAGNLVETVPPKGMKPLNSAQVTLAKSGTAVNPAHELPTPEEKLDLTNCYKEV